ncbi:MAG TPA: hypothetical protein VMU82_05755 [Acetobacteraceae bacterium]|nr:hypothetical protein [Acetobacteraceae bacterium]
MGERGRPFPHAWILVAGAVALIAAHGMILRHVLAHAALPAAVIAGVIVLVAIKHAGLTCALSARFRRRTRPRRE